MTKEERKQKMEEFNEKMKKLNSKIKDGTDTAIIAGMEAKDTLSAKMHLKEEKEKYQVNF